ncbi:hypothetical protein [Vagococcus xieshaowenii]|uniref:Uncharacterized protein n=1 Tax=Vagococcus xieshaowenii TaxID=2562451 RepID=A0AAJ5EEH2_9ENTE|nr:hypothetical protein [Vagococcus xieshaowenii]QCA28228.1 hypothetical protein E4Z98_02445 [Vagococcus xieshaowenii]TFZ41883.1 hypothetical protein E4031_04625 [Vagococcus xieshaowenii]
MSKRRYEALSNIILSITLIVFGAAAGAYFVSGNFTYLALGLILLFFMIVNFMMEICRPGHKEVGK